MFFCSALTICILVDLFVRSWVEMWYIIELCNKHYCRPLREVVSWNASWFLGFQSLVVDLFVRSWVEIEQNFYPAQKCPCRPLREVVSWNILNPSACCRTLSRPLREVVSWNLPEIGLRRIKDGRPLREVVSWNEMLGAVWKMKMVDLFVRSWVEILCR